MVLSAIIGWSQKRKYLPHGSAVSLPIRRFSDQGNSVVLAHLIVLPVALIYPITEI